MSPYGAIRLMISYTFLLIEINHSKWPIRTHFLSPPVTWKQSHPKKETLRIKFLISLVETVHICPCTDSSISSVNSLWPSAEIWWYRSGSTLAQVTYYLQQCWLIINDVLSYSPESNFAGNYIYLWYEFDNFQSNITAASSSGLRANFP